MIRRPPRSTLDRSSAASDVYKRQDVGRVRGVDVFYRVGSILVHRFGPGSGDVARSGHHTYQETSIRNFRSWLARPESELAPLRNGVAAVGRSFYAARSLGPQRRI